MKILHFEDDYPVALLTSKILKLELADKNVEVINIPYEKEMRQYLQDHPEPEVDLVILDVMVVYQEPKDRELEPMDIEALGPLRAGIRILQLMHGMPSYAGVPVLIYSNLPSTDIKNTLKSADLDPSNTKIVSKEKDGQELASAIAALVKAKR